MKPATIATLLVAALLIGVIAATNLFSNAFMLLTDRENFVPAESSIFSFAPTRINQGSSNYWVYGEDSTHHYYFSYEPAAPYLVISKSNTCQAFNPLDHTTWCAARIGVSK